MNPSAIEIEIQDLVLDGIAAESAPRLQAALSEQLGQLLAAQVPAGLASGGAVARLDGGAIPLAPGGQAEGVGNAVAGAVYRSLGGRP